MTKKYSSASQMYAHVPVSAIIDRDLYKLHPFHGTEQITSSLIESIKSCGLLVPPLVLATPTGEYELLCGRKRLTVVHQVLAQDEIFCRVLPPHTAEETILDFILEDQLLVGKLTIIEQSFFLRICDNILPQTDRRQAYLNALSANKITKGRSFLKALPKLPVTILNGLHQEELAESIISTLQNISDAEQLQLYSLIQSLQLSKSGQRRVAQGLYEMMRREDISLFDLLKTPEFDSILQQSKLTAGQKSARFLMTLERLLSPRLARATSIFNREIEKLQLPADYTVYPSKNFERDDIYLTVRFSTIDELKQYLAKKRPL